MWEGKTTTSQVCLTISKGTVCSGKMLLKKNRCFTEQISAKKYTTFHKTHQGFFEFHIHYESFSNFLVFEKKLLRDLCTAVFVDLGFFQIMLHLI